MSEDEGTPAPIEGSEPVEQKESPPSPPPQATPDESAALKARLEEKESFIGRQANELGELRKQTQYLQSMVEQFQMSRNQEPVEQSPPQGTPTKINWDDPDGSIARLVEEKLAAKEAQRQKFDQQRRAQVAYANFNNSWEEAIKRSPKLFEGIEPVVQQSVKNAFQSGIVNEYNITPSFIEKAARLILVDKGDFDRLIPQSPKPTRPTETETPTGRPISTEEVSVEIDERTRRFAQEQGLTEKQALEIMQGELKAASQGLNKSVRR
jgi:hypothetical protein